MEQADKILGMLDETVTRLSQGKFELVTKNRMGSHAGGEGLFAVERKGDFGELFYLSYIFFYDSVMLKLRESNDQDAEGNYHYVVQARAAFNDPQGWQQFIGHLKDLVCEYYADERDINMSLTNARIARILEYSFKHIDWKFKGLTVAEARIIGSQENFDAIKIFSLANK